jgi:hypothetical protein
MIIPKIGDDNIIIRIYYKSFVLIFELKFYTFNVPHFYILISNIHFLKIHKLFYIEGCRSNFKVYNV